MSEGELKKRIISLANTPTSSVMPDVLEELFPIIDEAKKEIFNVSYVYYKPKKTEGYLGVWTGHRVSDKPKQGYKKHITINEEAVKKWFGDVDV